MTSIRSGLAHSLLGGILVALAPSASLGNGLGLFHHPHSSYVTSSSSVGTTNVGTTGLLMPMAVTAPAPMTHVVAGGNVLMPMGLAPAVGGGVAGGNVLMPMGVSSNFLLPASGTAFYTIGTSNVGAAPVAASQNTLMPSDVSPVGGDYRAEFGTFVARENAALLSGTARFTTAQVGKVDRIGEDHKPLADLLAQSGGKHVLGSIARFLGKKLTDPKFDEGALDLFGMYFPVIKPFQPLIDSFLNDVRKGGGGMVPPPPPAEEKAPFTLGDMSVDFEGQVGPKGKISGRIHFGAAGGMPPGAFPPGVIAPVPAPEPSHEPEHPSQPAITTEEVIKRMGGTITSREGPSFIGTTKDGTQFSIPKIGKPPAPDE